MSLDTVDALPLSFAQERLWFLDRMNPGHAAYNSVVAWALSGDLDAAALERALAEIVRRHEALRTIFTDEDGSPRQVIRPFDGFRLPVDDLLPLPAVVREERVHRHIRAEAARPFDLSAGPLCRARLLRVDDDEHVLILSIHHIVTDGWSVGVLFRELTALYEAYCAGLVSPLPPLPVQYADYAAWQRTQLQGDGLTRQLAYWRDQLAGAPTLLSLPADRPRPAAPSSRGEQERVQFPLTLLERVRALGRQEGATLYMVLLAAFQVLLSKYSSSEDVVVGTPIAGRTRRELEGLIGFFANTLAMRTDLSGDPTFRVLLRRVRETALSAYEHQDVPFERVVAELQPERSTSHSPIFQVLCGVGVHARFGLTEARGFSVAGLRIHRIETSAETTIFDLVLNFIPQSTGLWAVLTYSTDLFERRTAQRMLRHLALVLEQMARDPDARLASVTLLDDAERVQIVETWNRTTALQPPDRTLHALFEEQAARTPDAVAVVADDGSLRYAELHARATAWAHHLRGVGVGPEVRVAVCLERRLALVAALLGVLKAGGAYVPLDPDYPADRLAFMLADADVRVLVTEDALRARVPAAPALTVLTVEGLQAAASREASRPAAPARDGGADSLAYVIYTSGSTGIPKGVAIAHRSAAALVSWAASVYDADELSGLLASTSICFDLSIYELFVPLACGGRVLLIDDALALPGCAIAAEVRVINTVPSAMAALLASGADLPTGVRTINLAGEPLRADLVDALYARGVARVYDLYGPSEDTTYSTFTLRGPGGPETIGRPIAHTQAYVLDAEGQPVPIGVPGELYLGGLGLARGYLGRPGLTAARFVPDPFGTVPGGRLYRTGDRMRWRADGTLEFLGRFDAQVKIRGHRIELDEIESVLRRHEAVQEAVVIAQPDEQRLIAYVVSARHESARDAAQLAEWQSVWDETYQHPADGPEDFNITGWRSSYTQAPIPEDEMRAWVDATVARIRALQPRRVLEIGCGTGLLLARLAPHCESYTGVDFSAQAVALVQRYAERQRLTHVDARHAPAHELSVVPSGSCDVIVINSVVQYFPDAGYLRRVLAEAVRIGGDGARIFVGDVRNFALAEAFHTAVQLHRAADDQVAAELKQRIAEAQARETELLIAPAFFRALPADGIGVAAAEILLKSGPCDNELTQFRYDVVLTVGSLPRAEAEPARWLAWDPDGRWKAEVERLVAGSAGSGEPVGVRDVPDARVTRAVDAAQRLARGRDRTAGLLRQASGLTMAGEHVDEIAGFAEACGVAWRTHGVDARGCHDVIFNPRPHDARPAPVVRAPRWSALTNDPRAIVRGGTSAILRQYLGLHLPPYMVPAAIVELDRLPRTPNGKLDRRALPTPRFTDAASYEGPRSVDEETLARIWADVLRVERVGRDDDFFALGGHSLLAMRVVWRIRALMGVELPLRALFEKPTIAALADRIETLRRANRPTLPPLTPAVRTGPLPLSFAQERLWFLDRLQPGHTAYSMHAPLRLTGTLDAPALERALGEIVRRHETLRSTFHERDGAAVQTIAPFDGFTLAIEDFSALDQAARDGASRSRLADAAAQAFDLEAGPLFRARLLRLGDRDHVLLISMHHIVCDGWSIGVLFRELTSLYAAYHAGDASPLAELPVQYVDYALWQRAHLGGEALARDLTYWKAQLAGAPPLLDLVTDHPRPTTQTFRGSSQPVHVPGPLVDRLQTVGQREGATLFMVLLAAFQVLLGKYAGTDDVVVGSPMAGRAHRELDGLIGLFLNTLALRTDLSGDPTFRDVLGRVRATTLAAYAHQDVPFERLVEELQPERSLSHAPLCEVLFNLQESSGVPQDLADVTVTPVHTERVTSKADLLLSLTLTAEGLVGGLTFRTDLYEKPTVQRLVARLGRLLEQVAADPDLRLSEIDLAHADERVQVIETWNETDAAVSDHLVHQRVEAQARRTPDLPAIACQATVVTYRDLNARADRLARELRSWGVGPEVRVGIHLERDPRMVVAVLAVLKAGGAYVPLDPSYPAERLSFMLADADCRVLLTQQELRDRLPVPATIAVVTLDRASRADEAPARADAETDTDVAGGEATGANLAYVLYTSGSTGQPKGVAVEHAAFAQYMAWAADTYPGRSSLLHSSLSFDFTLTTLFVPLLAGGCVELIPLADAMDDLADRLTQARGVDMLKLTPSHLRVLSELLRPRTIGGAPASLVVGGEALLGEQLDFWRRQFPDTLLINEYGPTETVVGCAIDVRPLRDAKPGAIPIGRPTPNTRVYVLDAAGRPEPIGLPGELYIGGRQLARGYWHRPALTAAAFVPDPFAKTPGARLYRTGDRVRWRADGLLEYLGRLDGQVKIRGFRIEPAEIERALRQHAGVTDCAVIVRDAGPGDTQLVAYVTGEVDTQALRDRVQRQLPPQMMPAAFVRVPRLPLTANGKLDRQALPPPDQAASDTRQLAPRTSVEATLASIWMEVLRRPVIGVTDNFFTLGGDSILSIQVVSRARRAGLRLTPQQMFQHQTIAELAAVVEETPARSRPEPSSTRQGAAAPGLPGLTPIQMSFVEQGHPAPSHYNQSMLLEVSATVSDATLHTAIPALLAQHDAMRLRVRGTPAAWEPWQAADAGVALERIDLAALPPDAQDRAHEETAERMQASLDLEQGPLVRVALFDRGTRGRLLFFVCHHLIVDGVSWRILREDLERICAQIDAGASPDLGPAGTSFVEWSAMLAAYAASDALRQEVPYWLAQGSDVTSVLAPDDCGVRRERGKRSLRLRFDTEETRALLEDVPAAYRTQINDALLCALADGIRSWSGRTSVRVSVEGHGRDAEIGAIADLTRTVGWFTALYPVVLDAGAEAAVGERLKRIKEQLRAVPNRGIGYGLLRYLGPDVDVRRALASHPTPEISFNYLGQFDAAGPGGSRFRLASGPRGHQSAPENLLPDAVAVIASITDGCLEMQWWYHEGTNRRDQIEALTRCYADALRAIIAHCRGAGAGACTPSDFPLAGLTPQELDVVAAGRRDVEDVYPLSPLQEGLLFHALDRDEAQAYQVQVVQPLEGVLDLSLFQHAWDEVVRRHAILRTAFVWAGVRQAVQRVQTAATVPWAIEDWRGLGADAQTAALERYLAADRARGFKMDEPPLMRCALFRVDDEHWFVWSYHHALLDGWSLSRVFNEVLAVYEASLVGATTTRTRRRPYRDYIAWLHQQDAAAAESYWRQVLGGFSSPTPLEVDRPSVAGAGTRYALEHVVLSHDRLERLQRTARDLKVTLNTMLQGAWALLLARYSGRDDLVFGHTVSGRPPELDGVEEMIGLFINTLPMRVRVTGDADLGSWLRTVQQQQVDARRYEYAPLALVQAWSEMPPGVPLFESHVAFENYAVEQRAEQHGVTPSLRLARRRTIEWSTYPLSLFVIPGRQMTLRLFYDQHRFDRQVVERLLRHLTQVLDQMASHPSLRLSDVTLLDDAERGCVLETWNRTDADHPSDPCVDQVIEAQAARTPDAIAVVCEDQPLTYRALMARADRLADRLVRHGVGPERRVGVYVERSLDMMIALLAVLKAGGVYLPLDPEYPAERTAFMARDAAIAVLLTQPALVARAPSVDAPIVLIHDARADDVVERHAAGSTDALASRSPVPVVAQNTAYVIYTSGSTGTPKGVQVTHANVVSFFAGMDGPVGGAKPGVWLAVTRIGFDIHVLELLWTLARGYRVIVQSDRESSDTGVLMQQIRRGGVTHLQCTPSFAKLLLADPDAAALMRLDRLLLGGEALPPDLARRIATAMPGRLTNMYGPTETTVWSTTAAIDPAEATVPIGRPIANTRVYVLDEAQRPQPVGVPGELYIGGAGVTRGYLHRPALTAERFVPDPFSASPGARLYRTGDRARWREDGVLECLGRVDAQVKIRGYRVEPGEIDTVLRRHPDVTEAVVVARPDASGDLQLLAYVIGDAAADTLREHVRRSLPDYMVPSAFVRLDALPLLPNGKLDRAALPAAADIETEAYVAPRTPVEDVLAGIWAEVLHVPRVGRTDNFFALGGHSLRAMRVISRMWETFGVRVAPRLVFDAPTVERLAARLSADPRFADAAAHVARERDADRIHPRTTGDAAPLSFGQERLWLHHHLDPASTAYNVGRGYRLPRLDLVVLERALTELVRRHEVLRTTFAEVDGAPVQIVSPDVSITLPIEDLSLLAPVDRDAEVARRVVEERTRLYDLTTGPLMRARLLRLGDEDVLVLAMHHIVSDGWSMGVLFRELSTLYEALCSHAASPLSPLPVQYADYAIWQRERLRGEALDGHLSYWRAHLTGAPALLELPTDRPRPAVQTDHGAAETIAVPADVMNRVRTLARDEGATVFMVLLAAFDVLLAKHAGTHDIVVGTPIAGRTRPELERLIGFFANTLVLRTDLSGDPSIRELLARVRGVTLAAYEHEDVPVERLVAELRPERSLSYPPLFQVVFGMDTGAETAGDGADTWSGERVRMETVSAPFDLSLMVSADGNRGALVYSTDVFEPRTARGLADRFVRVLDQMSSSPDLRLSEIGLLDEAERAQVVETWNATATDALSGACVHALFEEQAARTPAAVAVVADTETLTYAELNARANRLAPVLIARGVGPEVRVAICLDRGVELIVALLAVLKAGGVYVPVDPEYPAARVAFMLADAQARVIVTHDGTPSVPGVTVVRVGEAETAAAAAAPESNPDVTGVDAESLAYVMYTSGSTGQPKGVAVPHRAIVRLVRHATYAPLGPDTSMLQAAPVSFDAATFEIWGPLLNGGRLVMMPAGPASLEDLGAILRRQAVTTLWLTAGLFAAMVAERVDDLAGVRYLLAGGDVLPIETVQAVQRRWPALQVINGYGPTENTTFTCCYAVPAGWTDGAIPIGAPIAHTRVYVLDDAGQPVPVGVPGELYTGGAGVARGYLNRPSLTAARFVPDPFGPPGARLYRTGDRVRWRADGTLDFLGRFDTQVKIRGFRVEPGEIEAVVRAQAGVTECVVVPREHEAGEKHLVAYVAGAAEPAALRAALAAQLPGYLVPVAIVRLEALPRTPNGKLDRQTLPAPDYRGHQAPLPPRTELEQRVADVWRTVLAVAEIGVHDNFFDRGGSSLLLFRVFAQLKTIRPDLRMVDLFRHTTVAAIAEHLSADRAADRTPASAAAVTESRARAQQRRAARRRPVAQ